MDPLTPPPPTSLLPFSCFAGSGRHGQGLCSWWGVVEDLYCQADAGNPTRKPLPPALDPFPEPTYPRQLPTRSVLSVLSAPQVHVQRKGRGMGHPHLTVFLLGQQHGTSQQTSVQSRQPEEEGDRWAQTPPPPPRPPPPLAL